MLSVPGQPRTQFLGWTTLHVVSEDHSINRDRRERVNYIGFTAAVGILLLLNVTGVFSSILGIDTAIFITLIAGYGTFSRAIGE